MKLEAAQNFKSLVSYITVRRRNPEDRELNLCEKSLLVYYIQVWATSTNYNCRITLWKQAHSHDFCSASLCDECIRNSWPYWYPD